MPADLVSPATSRRRGARPSFIRCVHPWPSGSTPSTNGESKLGVDVQEDDDDQEVYLATRNQVKIVDDVPDGRSRTRACGAPWSGASAPAPATVTPDAVTPTTPLASPATPASRSLPWYYILLAASVAEERRGTRVRALRRRVRSVLRAAPLPPELRAVLHRGVQRVRARRLRAPFPVHQHRCLG